MSRHNGIMLPGPQPTPTVLSTPFNDLQLIALMASHIVANGREVRAEVAGAVQLAQDILVEVIATQDRFVRRMKERHEQVETRG